MEVCACIGLIAMTSKTAVDGSSQRYPLAAVIAHLIVASWLSGDRERVDALAGECQRHQAPR